MLLNTQSHPLGKALDNFDDEDSYKPEEEQDEREETLSPEHFLCDISEFQCPNEKKCIPHSALCDSNRDCWDGADEAHCPVHIPETHDNEDMSGDREVTESEWKQIRSIYNANPSFGVHCNRIFNNIH